jgi:hypothetical protein
MIYLLLAASFLMPSGGTESPHDAPRIDISLSWQARFSKITCFTHEARASRLLVDKSRLS